MKYQVEYLPQVVKTLEKMGELDLERVLAAGYVVDRNRTLVTNENYINLINKVESIDTRLTKIESEYRAESEKVFFDGEYLDARVCNAGGFRS